MPKKFHEYVYPGVHSDVGGSYRPGEGGKNENPDTKIGLIPLREMYNFALAAGVPFLPETAWEEHNHQDFDINPKVIKDFRYYFSRFEKPALTLGDAFNAHMKLYYAWRFRAIARKRIGDHSEAERIIKNEIQFKKEGDALDKKIAGLQVKHNTALGSVTSATWKRDDYVELNESTPERAGTLMQLNKDLASATLAEKEAKHQLLLEKAKLLALPKTSELPGIIEIYDRQLMLDVQAILEVIDNPKLSTFQRKFATGLSSLRPHYRLILEAYKAEFLEKKGLKDERIIDFFDNYVHDSLAGFGKDGTLPSDPRVVYVGDDEKLKYAGLGGAEEMHPVEHLA